MLFQPGWVLAQTFEWSSFVDSITSFSSPRPVELTGDGVMDIVVGGGEEGAPSNYGMMAFDGITGNLLWNVAANDEVFGSAVFQDITGDGIDDVFMGGRYAVFKAINGATGQELWDFFPYSYLIDPSDSGWYQFYSPQFIPDQNMDGYADILVTNGGDRTALPWDTIRPPGNVMVLDALTGNILGMAQVPDGKETYCSAIAHDLKGNGTIHVIFGTGGETIGGGLWVAELTDVMQNDISNAILLASDTNKGFIAPASVADLNNDGALDVIAQSFGGSLYAFNGSTLGVMWQVDFPGTESSAEPTIGNFAGSLLAPDIFNVLYKGVAPTYTDYYQVMINGATGQIEWKDSISDLHFASSVAFDYNMDGRDEVVVTMSSNNGSSFTHELKVLDFLNDTVFDMVPPEAGVGLASTPSVADMDQDGMIDLVYLTRADSINPVAANGIHLKRYSTSIDTMCSGIAWGSYMGNGYDGMYQQPVSWCGPLILNQYKNNPSCNGLSDGSITVSVSGGVAPYTYYWNNGEMADSISGLSAGIYGVTVVDASCCYITANITLSDPYVISFGGLTHNPCEGDSLGTATLASSGCPCMNSGCIFAWSNGDSTKTATGLPAGIHYATIIHPDGCIVTDSVEILAPTLIDSFQVGSIACAGELVDITLYPNDSNNTQYSWSNGAATSHVDSLGPGTYTVYVSNNVPCYDTLVFTIDSAANDTLDALISTIQQVSCNGYSDGVITGSGVGGTAPYTYNWNNLSPPSDSINTGLTAGNYTLYLSDANGCTDSVIVAISEPSEIIGSITQVSADCGQTGSIGVTASGGMAPYTYLWDDTLMQTTATATGLYPGPFSVLITDSTGCVTTVSDTLNGSPDLTISISHLDPSSCGGVNGYAAVTVLTGTSPYAYSWDDLSNQITDTAYGLTAGTYTITVLDIAGCSALQTVTLSDPNAPILSITDSFQVSCYGYNDGNATVTGFGGAPPFVYQWNTTPIQTSSQASGLTAGNYSVLVTDIQGCSASIGVSISEPQELVASLTLAIPPSIAGAIDGSIDMSVMGGTIPYYYQWSNGESSEDVTSIGVGAYSFIVTDENGCIDSLLVTINDGPVGVGELGPLNRVVVTPNPTTGPITFRGIEGMKTVYDLLGREVLSTYSNYMNLSHFNNGLYLIHIMDKNKQLMIHKIVKQ